METIRSSGRPRIHSSFRTAFFASLLAYTAFSPARTTGASPSIVNPTPTCNPTNTIAQIQGNLNTSSLTGTTVTTRGIVTGAKSNGFFIQMPAPGDGDSATSDGVFVFTSSGPPPVVVAGNDVCVSGKVQEFVPTSDPDSPPQTEITSVSNIFAI